MLSTRPVTCKDSGASSLRSSPLHQGRRQWWAQRHQEVCGEWKDVRKSHDWNFKRWIPWQRVGIHENSLKTVNHVQVNIKGHHPCNLQDTIRKGPYTYYVLHKCEFPSCAFIFLIMLIPGSQFPSAPLMTQRDLPIFQVPFEEAFEDMLRLPCTLTC